MYKRQTQRQAKIDRILEEMRAERTAMHERFPTGGYGSYDTTTDRQMQDIRRSGEIDRAMDHIRWFGRK